MYLIIIITFHSSGGVELLVKDGNIKYTNTLKSRLELLGSQVRRGRGSCSDLKCLCVVSVDDA